MNKSMKEKALVAICGDKHSILMALVYALLYIGDAIVSLKEK
jgi:hypothetical protein